MSTTNGPAVRAAHLKDDLWALAQLGPAASRIRARVGPDAIAKIEQAQPGHLIPVAVNVAMAEAVFAETGADGARRWGTASLLHSFDGFFKPIFIGLTKAIGPSPALLFKAFPQGWTTAYRGCGHVTVTHPAPGVTRVIIRDLPKELRSTPFLSAVCGSLEVAFHLSKYEGRAILEPRAPDAAEASWLVEWRPVK